ncbi:MAG: sulfurtransferase [Litorilinea sp.]
MSVNTPDSHPSTHLHADVLLVTPAWVADRLAADGLVILDVRTAQEYAEGHLPGAVNVELSRWTTVRDGVPGMLIEPAAFAQLVGSAGIDNATDLVIYDANWGMPAARVFWSFRRYGHSRVAVVNGGWDQWTAENRPVSTDPVSPQPTTYAPPDLTTGVDHLAELSWLQAQGARADLVIVDTRSPKEFEQGHLPNAINWDWLNAVPVGEWEMLRPAEELRAELAELGITPDREIVTYCRSGARAAHTYLVLRQLGYPRVRNYDGSWLEWSQRVLGQPAH